MHIRTIQLRNYRVYRHLDLEMPAGVVGVYGSNGSGKSTLLESIVWALFGKARTQKQQIPTVGETGECSATLEFEHEGHFYRVRRSISGQSFSVKARVWFGEEVAADGPSEVEKFIQSVLGMDAASFRASVFAEQKQLAAFSDQAPDKRRQMVLQLLGITPLEKARDRARVESRDLKAQIERAAPLLTSLVDAEALVVTAEANLSTARAAHELSEHTQREAEAAALTAAGAFADTETAQRRDAALRERGTAVRKELDQLGADRTRALSEVAALDSIPSQLAELRSVAEQTDSLEELEQLLARFVDRAERLGAVPNVAVTEGPPDGILADALLAKQSAAASRDSATGRLSALETSVNSALALVRRSEALDGEAACPTCGQALGANIEQMRAHHHEELQRTQQAVTEAQLVVKTATDAAKAATTAHSKLEQQAQAAAASKAQAAAALGRRQQAVDELGAATSALRGRLHSLNDGTAGQAAKGDLASFEIKALEMTKALDAFHPADGEPHDPESRPGVTSLATAMLQAVRRALGTAREARGKAEGLATQLESRDRLTARLRDYDQRVSVLDAERTALLAEFKGLSFDRAAFDAVRQRKELADQTVVEARRAVQLTTSAMGRAQGLAEAARSSLADATTRHQTLAQQLEDAQLLLKAATLLHDFRQHIVGLIGPQLRAQASALFNDLTNNEYDGLDVDPDSYELKIIDQGTAHPTSRFSGSEVDLANLALRVAISEQVRFQAGGQVGLLVLDEALSSLDADRKDRTLAALAQLGGRFQQILVVTHSPEVKEQLPAAIEIRRTTNAGIRTSTAEVLGAS